MRHVEKLGFAVMAWFCMAGVAFADLTMPGLESGMHYLTDGTGGHALATGVGIWSAIQMRRHGEIAHELITAASSITMILGINRIATGNW